MTYCCGVLVRDGLVMIADTRTNAGLDNVSTFRKLHIFTKPGERVMAIASAGNLAISQSVLSTLTEGLEDPTTGDIETLTVREREVLAYLMKGQTVREIATECVVAEATVRTQVKSILAKLEVSSQLAAVGMANEIGWRAPAA